MIKAVVFDLDDTLYPESQYVMSGFKAVAQYVESKTAHRDQFIELKKLFDEDRTNVFDRLIIKEKLLITKDELHRIYINHAPSINLFEDALPFLGKLSQQKIKMGIITDGRPIQQKNKISALKIEHFFEKIIITDEIGLDFRKPHPLVFQKMKEALNVDYEEMLYVGDNPSKDFHIKSIFPIKTIQILRNGYYDDGSYLDNIKPDIIINNLEELCSLI